MFWTLQDLKAMKTLLGMESEGIVCLRLKSFTKTFFSGKRFYRFLICLLKNHPHSMQLKVKHSVSLDQFFRATISLLIHGA